MKKKGTRHEDLRPYRHRKVTAAKEILERPSVVPIPLQYLSEVEQVKKVPWQEWETEYLFATKGNGTWQFPTYATFAAAKGIDLHTLTKVVGKHSYSDVEPGIPYHGDWNEKRKLAHFSSYRSELKREMEENLSLVKKAEKPASHYEAWMARAAALREQVDAMFSGELFLADELDFGATDKERQVALRANLKRAHTYMEFLEQIQEMEAKAAQGYLDCFGMRHPNVALQVMNMVLGAGGATASSNAPTPEVVERQAASNPWVMKMLSQAVKVAGNFQLELPKPKIKNVTPEKHVEIATEKTKEYA